MGPYAEGWKTYRRYRRDFWLVWIGYIPVVGAIAFVSQWLFHSFVPAMVAAAFWMLLFLFVGIRYQTFPCPRCGESFSAKWWYNLGFLARKCVHCRLPKFSEDGN
jgi:hypothetical protein